MIANWSSAKDGLSAKMLTHGLRLPGRPIADGRWHECDAGKGHYLLFPDLLIAIYCGVGDVSPIVWQNDDRLLSHALQQRIADAIARRPMPRAAPKHLAPAPKASEAVGSTRHKQTTAKEDGSHDPSSEPVPSGTASFRPVSAFRAAEEAGASTSTDDRHPTVRPVEPEVLRMFGVRPGSAVARAIDALAEWLSTGPVRTIEIKERAKQAGFSWATIRRAADVLPVRRVREGYGGAGAWWWARDSIAKWDPLMD
jgi:hypothetical protein